MIIGSGRGSKKLGVVGYVQSLASATQFWDWCQNLGLGAKIWDWCQNLAKIWWVSVRLGTLPRPGLILVLDV